MWCVVMTETGIQGEARNPAHVVVEAFEKLHDAGNALRRMYADKASALSGVLEYSEYTGREARLFGDMAVVVIAMKELPDPTGAKNN